MDLDGANGVGAISTQGFIKAINPQVLKINIYNDNVENGQLLNSKCGADFVKVQQKSPETLPGIANRRCVSFDGDADRVVYFYTDDSGVFHLLDGDRIATLSKFEFIVSSIFLLAALQVLGVQTLSVKSNLLILPIQIWSNYDSLGSNWPQDKHNLF